MARYFQVFDAFSKYPNFTEDVAWVHQGKKKLGQIYSEVACKISQNYLWLHEGILSNF